MTAATIQFLIGIGTMLAIAIITLAQQRKISREQFDASKKEWQDVATLQKERISALERRVEDLQGQINDDHTALQRIKGQRDQWSERNAYYWELIKEYRGRLRKHGEETPEPENGE